MPKQITVDDEVWNELINLKYKNKNKTLSDVVRILIIKVTKMEKKQ